MEDPFSKSSQADAYLLACWYMELDPVSDGMMLAYPG